MTAGQLADHERLPGNFQPHAGSALTPDIDAPCLRALSTTRIAIDTLPANAEFMPKPWTLTDLLTTIGKHLS